MESGRSAFTGQTCRTRHFWNCGHSSLEMSLQFSWQGHAAERLKRSMLHLSAWSAHVPRSPAPHSEGYASHAPYFRDQLGPANYKKRLLIDDYLSEIFAAVVPDGEEHKYKPTIALANLLFSAPNLDAVNYPSVATANHGINVCTLPDKADQLFSPLEAWMIRVGKPPYTPRQKNDLTESTFSVGHMKLGQTVRSLGARLERASTLTK